MTHSEVRPSHSQAGLASVVANKSNPRCARSALSCPRSGRFGPARRTLGTGLPATDLSGSANSVANFVIYHSIIIKSLSFITFILPMTLKNLDLNLSLSNSLKWVK